LTSNPRYDGHSPQEPIPLRRLYAPRCLDPRRHCRRSCRTVLLQDPRAWRHPGRRTEHGGRAVRVRAAEDPDGDGVLISQRVRVQDREADRACHVGHDDRANDDRAHDHDAHDAGGDHADDRSNDHRAK
jgi:hypothetical protein